MMQRNNQPRVGISDRLDAGEEACWSGSAGGDTIQSFGAANGATKNKKNNLHRGLRLPPINNNTHNNQPKTGGRNGGDNEGRCNKQDMRGKHDTIVLGAL